MPDSFSLKNCERGEGFRSVLGELILQYVYSINYKDHDKIHLQQTMSSYIAGNFGG